MSQAEENLVSTSDELVFGSERRFGFLPNPLATRLGRLATFFFLYMTEGVPLGFTATAVATYMRRQGVPAGQVTMFVGTLYLPWSWKWVIGPVVDLVYSNKLGRRRGWIIAAQFMMVVTLLASMPVDFAQQLKLFTAIILVLNIFGATQDVAIDALACNVLREDERGLANGLMFGGAYLGQALGGSGVLYLTPLVGFKATFFFVAAAILSVTLFVAVPMMEPRYKEKQQSKSTGSVLSEILAQVKEYIVTAVRAMFGSRPALFALAFALLPAGGYALSLAPLTNLGAEFGLSDSQIATITLASTLISAVCCIVGGFLSDRFGRRKMLALYILGTAFPTILFGLALYHYGWIYPVDLKQPGRPTTPTALINAYWAAVLAFSACQGLLYGTRTALFMDVCDPTVAATQFTAYMALLNFVVFYSGIWQGLTIKHWGYPTTFFLDAGYGLVCLLFLPWIRPVTRSNNN